MKFLSRAGIAVWLRVFFLSRLADAIGFSQQQISCLIPT